MSVDKNLIKEKLQRIDRLIKNIESMNFSEDQFLENIDYQDLLIFRLQQAIELSIDIATHIIASSNFEKPETARSSFEVLAKNKVIDKDLSEKLMLAVSFRNIVVHKYDDIDFRQVFKDYKEDLESLKMFISEIIKYLG